MHDFLNPTLDRRAALRRLSGLLGGIATAPLISGVLSGCTAPAGEEAAAYTYATFDEPQQRTIAALVDQVIPPTDTPGAAEAGVPQFIDTMLSDWFKTEDAADFLAGLAEFDARAQAQYGAAFADLDAATQQAMVEALDTATYAPMDEGVDVTRGPVTQPEEPTEETAAEMEAGEESDVSEMGGGGGGDGSVRTPSAAIQVNPDAPPFFRVAKELVVVGYYTSEVGATQELRWNPAPGRWDPDVPVTEDTRAWA